MVQLYPRGNYRSIWRVLVRPDGCGGDVGFDGFDGFLMKKIVRQIQGLEPSRCHAVNLALACALRPAIHRNMCHQWIQEPMRCLMNQQLTCDPLGNGTIS
jgi:hypothetical protein